VMDNTAKTKRKIIERCTMRSHPHFDHTLWCVQQHTNHNNPSKHVSKTIHYLVTTIIIQAAFRDRLETRSNLRSQKFCICFA
jgi:hypothetical protein